MLHLCYYPGQLLRVVELNLLLLLVSQVRLKTHTTVQYVVGFPSINDDPLKSKCLWD